MNDTDEASRDPVIHLLLLESMDGEPAQPPAAHQIAKAHRYMLRRRVRMGALCAAVGVAVVALVPAALMGSATRTGPALDQEGRLSDTDMVSLCRNGNQSDEATEAMFGSGPPTLQQNAMVAEQVSVVLVSADGSHWADCFINLYEGAEFTAGMTLYPARASLRDQSIHWASGYTCHDLDGPPSAACATFFVDYVDRVADEVAAVTFTTADERATTVNALDGYVVFAYEGTVPANFPNRETGSAVPPQWLERITYLAADGTPLAAQNLGETSPDEMSVGNLPRLSAYPSRRGAPIE